MRTDLSSLGYPGQIVVISLSNYKILEELNFKGTRVTEGEGGMGWW